MKRISLYIANGVFPKPNQRYRIPCKKKHNFHQRLRNFLHQAEYSHNFYFCQRMSMRRLSTRTPSSNHVKSTCYQFTTLATAVSTPSHIHNTTNIPTDNYGPFHTISSPTINCNSNRYLTYHTTHSFHSHATRSNFTNSNSFSTTSFCGSNSNDIITQSKRRYHLKLHPKGVVSDNKEVNIQVENRVGQTLDKRIEKFGVYARRRNLKGGTKKFLNYSWHLKGMSVNEALIQMRFARSIRSYDFHSMLRNAQANAVNQFGMNPDHLVISLVCFVFAFFVWYLFLCVFFAVTNIHFFV